jgi:hypothetical protein
MTAAATASTTAMRIDMDGAARKIRKCMDRLTMNNRFYLCSLLDYLMSRFITRFGDCHYY